jgi:hypothetical protein
MTTLSRTRPQDIQKAFADAFHPVLRASGFALKMAFYNQHLVEDLSKIT